jgi:hypothetical protein
MNKQKNMTDELKTRRSFPLRLSQTMRRQANDLAHGEGISLNHFISLAVAEKISRMEHTTWLKEMAKVQHEPPAFAASPLFFERRR